MFDTQYEVFHLVSLVSVFFVLLIAIIIITALLYHSNKRLHKMEVANFKNTLLQSQLEVQEQTLQTIGTDLHDNIGQILSLTYLTLHSIEVDKNNRVYNKIDTAINLTNRSIEELKLLGKLIQGENLIELGLSNAIAKEVQWVQKAGKHKVYYSDEDILHEVNDPNKNLIVFRVLQETLNNIIKHAEASEISIKLSYKEGILQLTVTDNGKGFNASEFTYDKDGMGLFNIHNRVIAIGGKSDIRSTLNEGTTVEINIPYP